MKSTELFHQLCRNSQSNFDNEKVKFANSDHENSDMKFRKIKDLTNGNNSFVYSDMYLFLPFEDYRLAFQGCEG